MHLSDLWFILIGVLWAGYFALDGFDLGVGILLPVLGGGEAGRRVTLAAIGPVWDANEVWLIVAGGAMFAAYPGWYAAMFSAFYLPLLVVLVALIVRGVAFEYRGKRDSARWRAGWDACTFAGSLVPAIAWGVVFGNVLRGIPIDAAHDYTGNVFTFLNPYALLGGLATLVLFTAYGAMFLTLKTTGHLRERANTAAGLLCVVAIAAGGGFLAWTEASFRAPGHTGETGAASVALAALAAVALIGALVMNRAGREGPAFGCTAAAILAVTGALFTALYPRVLPSTLNAAWDLTTGNAAAAANTLAVMTVVAVIFLPPVLAYQSWTYWVFRQRITAPAVE
jgi:cytochrome d ubiquinol oxidase subunit II